ncbi:MAG: dockerin type I repeat-containing protein [Ruminococcus sp.]
MTFKSRMVRALLMLGAAVLMLAGTVTAFAGSRLGDADGDGEVTIGDVTCIQMKLAEMESVGSFCADSADVNGSGEIEITDATLIQMWLAEVETPYSIGEQPTEAPTQMPTDADGWGRIVFRP